MISLLLVDDEKGITDALKIFFEHRGFSVRCANTGEKALQEVTSHRPDIVFLDIRMRGMSGLDVLERIKKMDKTIKVIMLTVHEEKEIMERARELGADEYITKPIKGDELSLVIERISWQLMAGENKSAKPGTGLKSGN